MANLYYGNCNLSLEGSISERKTAFGSLNKALSDGVLNSLIIFKPRFSILSRL